MDKYLSQSKLEKIYKNELKSLGSYGVGKLKESNRLKENQLGVVKIFLCHSHLDKTIVDKMLVLFEQLRVEAYVDWMDELMPNHTSHKTATLIKSKIENCDKFIFLATFRALSSKWCNWELGLAFSLKKEKDFAILPIESKGGNWPGNEYLGLYPTMRIHSTLDPEIIHAEDISINASDKVISLYQWLHS